MSETELGSGAIGQPPEQRAGKNKLQPENDRPDEEKQSGPNLAVIYFLLLLGLLLAAAVAAMIVWPFYIRR
jgi:hypothetical protein